MYVIPVYYRMKNRHIKIQRLKFHIIHNRKTKINKYPGFCVNLFVNVPSQLTIQNLNEPIVKIDSMAVYSLGFVNHHEMHNLEFW